MSNQFLKAIFIVFIGGYCMSCATIRPKNMVVDSQFLIEELKVLEPQDPPKAVILLLHGLNLKPQKMDAWADALAQKGAITIRIALMGHRGQNDKMADVSAQIWHDQFERAIALARLRAKEFGVPIGFLGFSLGALVGLEWLSQSDPVSSLSIHKMVLLAPAISTPWYGRSALNMFSIFGKGFSLPSRTPSLYRANNGSTLSAYRALFELKDSLEKNHFRNTNIPALVIIDKNDELISSKDIQKIITEQKLGHWVMDLVDNRYAYDNFGFRHLMVDEESLGPKLWEELKTKVFAHFEL